MTQAHQQEVFIYKQLIITLHIILMTTIHHRKIFKNSLHSHAARSASHYQLLYVLKNSWRVTNQTRERVLPYVVVPAHHQLPQHKMAPKQEAAVFSQETMQIATRRRRVQGLTHVHDNIFSLFCTQNKLIKLCRAFQKQPVHGLTKVPELMLR